MKKLYLTAIAILVLFIAPGCNMLEGCHSVSASDDLYQLVLEGEGWLEGKNNSEALETFNKAINVYEANTGADPDLGIRAYDGKICAEMNLCSDSGIFFSEIVEILVVMASTSSSGTNGNNDGNNDRADSVTDEAEDFFSKDPYAKNPLTGERDNEYAKGRWTRLRDAAASALDAYKKIFETIEPICRARDDWGSKWKNRFTTIGIEQMLITSIKFAAYGLVMLYDNLQLLDEYGLTLDADLSNIDEIEEALKDAGEEFDLTDEAAITEALDDLGITYDIDPDTGMPTNIDTSSVDTENNPFGEAILEAVESMCSDDDEATN